MSRDPLDHNFRGPGSHFGAARKRVIEPLQEDHDERIRDEANGAVVPRCWNCGRPGIGRRIYAFELVANHRSWGRWQLCSDCLVSRNPQPDPDPLSVTEAA